MIVRPSLFATIDQPRGYPLRLAFRPPAARLPSSRWWRSSPSSRAAVKLGETVIDALNQEAQTATITVQTTFATNGARTRRRPPEGTWMAARSPVSTRGQRQVR